jgi:CO/xanthine dehydrogenase FAD-binding subunit
MIIEYQRPKTISEALTLLARKQPISYPLGGGTFLNRTQTQDYAVVDLQALGLSEITKKGKFIQVGATATLQDILECKGLPEDLYNALKLEATYNLRQMSTITGTLVTANGRSPLTTILLSLDTSLEFLELDQPSKQVRLGDWLPIRQTPDRGKLISKVIFPTNVNIAYESISRSPADQPILCVAATQWASGRTRLALGGWGSVPILAMDGTEAQGAELAAKDAYSHAVDEWASAEYREEMAGILSIRCISRLAQR